MTKTKISAILFGWLVAVLSYSGSVPAEEIQEKIVSLPRTTENVEIRGLFEVKLSITTGDSSLVISSEASNLPKIIVDVNDETVFVHTKGRILSDIMRPKVVIKIPQLVTYTSSGTTDSVLRVNVRGPLTIKAAGVSKINLYGYADTLNIDASGTSKIHADTFNVNEATVKLKGISFAYFKRTTRVSQQLSGVSKVYLLD